MRIDFDWLPMATPIDPAEEPQGSIDPLGTLADAERLGEALLPGFTARMWRGRLLTFATVAAAVTDRTVALMGGREELRLDARLAFERLFVSSIVRMADRDPATYAHSPRRLPGRDLAEKALRESEPLTRANFLKGQAVNGPFGVIARLADHMELIADDGHMGRKAYDLLMAWSDDEGLPGLFDEDPGTKRAGAKWMTDIVKQTAACVRSRDWPSASHGIWERLARHLRPDRIGPKERRTLVRLLDGAAVRQRVVQLLRKRADVYRKATRESTDRGKQERAVLLRGLRPELSDEPTDRLIAALIEAVDAYERTSALFQQAFDGVIWGLKVRGGRSRPDAAIADARLHRHLTKTLDAMTRLVPRMDRAIGCLRDHPSVDPAQLVEPMLRLRDDFRAASASVPALIDTMLSRHERVQREKGKAPWIERASHWTLMPGENRVSAEAPPAWHDTYLHPFKIRNAYSILGDLRRVTVEVRDGG